MNKLIKNGKNMSSIFSELWDKTVEDVFEHPFSSSIMKAVVPLFPSIEVQDEAEQIIVKVELPGMKKEDVNVEISDGVLTISGERKTEKKDNVRSEISYGAFSRSFTLPENIDTDKIDGGLKNGIMELKISKKLIPQKEVKKIALKD